MEVEPLHSTPVDELDLDDPDAQRLARFFADLMVTLAEGGVEGAESAEAARALWHSGPEHLGRTGPDVGPEVLVYGLGALAAALARQLASERRAARRPDACVAAVWNEVGRALDAADSRRVGTGNGRHDPS